jgi:hypothetical protein
MYYEDLTPYTYTDVRLPGDAPSLVNFGWLDSNHDYRHGQANPELIERILRLAAKYTNSMRGYHRCPFCRDGTQVTMLLGNEVVYLGHAEIRITAGDTTYVAPSLLPHYMDTHEYVPPAEIIWALEQVNT